MTFQEAVNQDWKVWVPGGWILRQMHAGLVALRKVYPRCWKDPDYLG